MSVILFVLVLLGAGFGYAIWEETRDRKIMNDLFFAGLITANKVAEENAQWDASIQKAKAGDNL